MFQILSEVDLHDTEKRTSYYEKTYKELTEHYIVSLECDKMSRFIKESSMFQNQVDFMEAEERVNHYEKVIKDATYYDKIKACKELEQYIVSLEPDIMSKFVVRSEKTLDDSEERLLTLMIIQHTLVTFNTRHHMDTLLYTCIYHASCYLYLSLYFNGVSPSDSFRTLHQVWKSNPGAELKLKLCYCNVLLKYNHYNMLKQLINDNKEDFLSTEIWPHSDMCTVWTWVMLYLLSQSITQHRTDIIIKILLCINNYFEHVYVPTLPLHLDVSFIEENLMTYILNLNGFNEKAKFFKLQICLLYCQKLRNQNNYMRYKSFIEQHIYFIWSMADQLGRNVTCTMRKQYTLVLMHYCAVSTDTKCTDLVLVAIQELRLSLLKAGRSEYDCYCYGGKTKYESYKKNLNFDFYFRFRIFGVLKKNLRECCKHIVNEIEKNYEIDRPRESVVGEGSITKMNTGRIQKCKGKLYNRAGLVNDVSRIIEDVLDNITLQGENLQCRLNEIIEVLSNLQMQPETQDIIAEGVSSFINMIYSKNKGKVFTLLLDLHMETCGNSFVNNLTKCVGQLLNFEDDIINDDNRILYRCFCTLRTAGRRNKELSINIEKYNQHFTFIPLFDKEEEIQKLSKMTGLLVMLLLLLTTITTGGHHKSAELKKYLSLKYEYDDAILYLLWCSGDVEINPGPTLKKLKPLRSSEKNRKWINEMCSTLVKLVKGIAVNSKPKSLWKDKPIHWPQDQPFFDPSNKSEVGNDDDQSEKRLLNCLLDYCEKMGTRIPEHFQREITAWKDGNKTKLFEIYIERKELTEIDNAIQILNKYAETTELKKCLSDVKILIDHKVTKRHHNSMPNLSHADIIRDLALTFCRISKGLNPVEKSDGIWKVSPTCWESGNPFYSPHNAGKRTEKGQDKNLVNNLLKYCDDNDIAISPRYKVLTAAWKLGSKDDLHRVYTVWSSTVIIEHSLKYLQLEGILEKHSTLGKLKNIGLTLDSKAWDLNSGLDISPSQDSGFNDSDCSISSPISSPDVSRKDKMKSLKNEIQQVKSKHPSDHQQSSPCNDNDFITHASLSLVYKSKSDTKLPSMSKSDTKLPSMSKSDTMLPSMSKLDTKLPSMSKSDTKIPSMSKLDTKLQSMSKSDTKISSTSKSDTKLSSMSKSDTKLPSNLPSMFKSDTKLLSMSKSDSKLPSMSKSDTKLPSMSKSDTKISSMSHESDIKLPSKSKSDTKLPDENVQSTSYVARCPDTDIENQSLTKILPCGGKEYGPNLSKPSTTSNNLTAECGVGYCAAASGSLSAFENENDVVVKSRKESNNRRKLCCDTRGNGKKLKLSDTTVQLSENTINPGPVDVHIDTPQQTDSDLNLSDDFIVSMVDQMNQDLTESDLKDSITTTEDDTNTDLSSELPDEIIASYINDFLTCDNPEEKLEKDMDL